MLLIYWARILVCLAVTGLTNINQSSTSKPVEDTVMTRSSGRGELGGKLGVGEELGVGGRFGIGGKV